MQSDPLMLFLQGLWADVLNESAANITPSSDFFALGGNSLLVGVMNSRLRAHLKAPAMSGLLLYQSPSLQDFAAAVRAAVRQLPDSMADKVTVVCGENSSSSSSRYGSGSSSCSDDTAASSSAATKGGKKGGCKGSSGSGSGSYGQPASARSWLVSATAQQMIGAAFGLSVEFMMELVPLLMFEVRGFVVAVLL
jgi:hypothetical protein